MTSILKADNIQDADGNNIINESGNTITIGAAGDTTNIIGTLQNDGAAVSSGLTSTQVFTSSGTWTKPSGITKVRVYVTGGGGVDSLFVAGDLYVSCKIDGGNKGRLASRFATADSKPKPFDIKHPSKEGWRLRYACIEGPEVGVYCRGRVRNEKIIKLPDYWKDLVDIESISVQLQPIGAHQDVIVKRWDENFIYLQAQGGMPVNCFYHVYAARKDVNPLYVEYEGESWKDYPDPNFNPEITPENPNYNDPEYRTKRNTITI